MTVYARIRNQITTVPSYPNGLKIGAYLFPTSDGSNGQALITNGSGTVSWGNAGAQLSGTNTWTGTQTFSNATYSALFTGGNVGIGTSSPNLKSEIWQIASGGTNVATSALRTTPQLLLKGFGGSSTYHSGIAFSMNEHTSGYWGSGILSHDDTGLYGSALTFYTSTGLASASPTEKMRITSSGNVGIGTTSPRNFAEFSASTVASSSSTGLRLGGIVSTYTPTNYTGLNQEINRHSVVFSSWRDAQTDTIGAKIAAINYTAYNNISVPNSWHFVQFTDLAFYTLGVIPTSTDATSERMRITSSGNVGIGTNSPTSTFHVNGSVAFKTSTISANTTLDGTYTHVFASGTITITLPTAVGIAGRTYWIKKTDSGTTLTVATTSSQTIDGAQTLSVTTKYNAYTLVSDGSNWFIM